MDDFDAAVKRMEECREAGNVGEPFYGDHSTWDVIRNGIASIELQNAAMRALLNRSREWIRGDKWRFSDVPGQREAWEKFLGDIDAALNREFRG